MDAIKTNMMNIRMGIKNHDQANLIINTAKVNQNTFKQKRF